MGLSVLKAVVLFALLIVCVNSQLEFQVSGLNDERNPKTEAVKERDNSLCQQQVIIEPPGCSDDPSSSCNCTKIQELMSVELQATNRQLQQLQTAVSDQQGLISSGLEDTKLQLHQLQLAVSDIAELLTNSSACRDPLGMESGEIPNSDLATSSVGNPGYHKEKARLYSSFAWCANIVNLNQWIRVDLRKSVTLTGLITQGRHHSNVWTTSYHVDYSFDASNWAYVKGTDGSPIEFKANTDDDTPVTNYFPAVVRTRYMRIRPVTWERWICIRFELLGCRDA